MSTTAIGRASGILAVCLAAAAAAADVTISDVVARQRRPWSRLVAGGTRL